jgi:hypothetical protein
VHQDRVGPIGGFGALVVTLGAFLIIGAGFAAPLFIGSAMLMWDLARIGAVSRLVPIVHVATAILVIIGSIFGQNGADQGDLGRGISAVLFTSYMLTWGAIGVSLIRGVPKPRRRAPDGFIGARLRGGFRRSLEPATTWRLRASPMLALRPT